MKLQVKNSEIELLHQKAIWWEAESTLIISDLHIGKIAHFRKAGIAVPKAAINQNFLKLDLLMITHPVKRIVFTGDLFHSDINHEWEDFCNWRKDYMPVDMHIVLGNHDRLPRNFCNDYNMTIHQKELVLEPFTFTHHPKKTFLKEEFVLCGHIHPVIRITGKANQSFKFPCFHISSQQVILPSFGYFTGGYIIEPGVTDTVVAIVKDKLIPINTV